MRQIPSFGLPAVQPAKQKPEMIRDHLIPAVKEAFPDKPFLFSSPPNPIIRLPSGCTGIGDLAIYDDGDNALVCFTEITHGHSRLSTTHTLLRIRWIRT